MAALLGGLGLATVPTVAQATPSFELTRLAGNTRTETAVEISEATFPAGAGLALIAADGTANPTGGFADPLAGNYLAADAGSPILLSGQSSVPQATLDELVRLGATDVVLLGGTLALADSVQTQLAAAGYEVGRVAGINRFSTAAAVAQARPAAEVGLNENGLKTAVLSSGFAFPDALAAGPIVYADSFPQLLTPDTSLAVEAVTAMDALGVQHVILTGGTVAIAASVEAALVTEGFTVERIAGATRFGTATMLADKAIDVFGHDDTNTNVAFARNFPDALAGGPHAGEENSTIVLSETASVDATTCAFLTARAPTLASGHLYGGTAAVSDATKTGLEACAQAAGGAGTGQVVDVNNGAKEYMFVDNSTDEEVTVVHDSGDTFRVDGADVSQAIFEGAITPGDNIAFTDDETLADEDVHDLTNVEVTAGLVGDVNTGADVFDIVNPVTGTVVGDADPDTAGLQPFTYGEGDDTYTVDGASAAIAVFEDDINEGDTVTVTDSDDDGDGETFALVNADATGEVTGLNAVGNMIEFQIDEALGDEHQSVQGVNYRADDPPVPGDEIYNVDGDADVAYMDFFDAISDGDRITYSREDDVETFDLTNEAPALVAGTAVDDLDIGPDTFTVVNEDGPEVADYSTGTTVFTVDGVVVTEVQFEAAYTAGDEVEFQAGDDDTSTSQTLDLTNADLTGQLADPQTGTKSYEVLGPDGDTTLATISYVPDGTNDYSINGTDVVFVDFEIALDALDLDADDQDDTITFIDAVLNLHELVTDDDVTP